jgi:hypothetical protein
MTRSNPMLRGFDTASNTKPSSLLRFGRADERRAYRFGHAEEDHDRVGGKLCGLRLVRDLTKPRLRVVKAIANPGIALAVDRDGMRAEADLCARSASARR